jgi:hypothetical protein
MPCTRSWVQLPRLTPHLRVRFPVTADFVPHMKPRPSGRGLITGIFYEILGQFVVHSQTLPVRAGGDAPFSETGGKLKECRYQKES